MIPRWRGTGAIGDYRRVTTDPVGFLADVARAHGDFVRIDFLNLRFYLVNDPALIHEALVEKSEALIIMGGVSRGLARLIGDGILTNRGERWRESRARLKPLFNQAALAAHTEGLVDRVKETLERWRTTFADEPVDLHRELLALSCRIECSVLFDYLPSFEQALSFADAIRVLQREGMDRFLAGGDLTPWLPTSRNRTIAGALATLARLALDINTHGSPQPVEEILSLLYAGTESPVTTLCFALAELEQHPDWHARLQEEVLAREEPDPFRGGTGAEVLDQVLNECLRLYPAGWAFERCAAEAVTLGGEPIAKGARLVFCPQLLHRSPKFWRDPDRFDPSRFAQGPNVEGVPKYGFLPFGAGPRSCIGSRLAMAQMRVVLRMIVSECRWRTEPRPDEPPLRPEGSFKLRLSQEPRVRVQFPTTGTLP